ncbi:DNA/RNA polymerases superfamily protein [Senna tora]|uniref:DNA/RNA polymerases superfamily protein n=1 Tax=Senna tora TaxID=362788 RepID=A0A834W3T6_9FABA|nr:DNA/RNA polymerases superfamily protein [Senna tora]
MSQREGIVEDVNDESSAHHEAAPPPEGRGRGRSSGSNRGRGRPRGRGRTSRGGRAIKHLINELVGNPMPQQIPMPQPNPMPQQNLASTQDEVGALPLDWEEFKKDFLEWFLPESVREARAREFLLFKQTSEMTVAEYSTQLIRLSKYAPHSTSTERELIKRFVQGLLPPLFRAMIVPQGLKCYEKKENDAAKKRNRGGEDRYGSSSIGGFSKGTKAHTHQRFSQSPSGFSAPSYVSPNRQRTDSQNTKSSTQQGPSQQKHIKSSCPACGKFHSGLCYRGSGACYRCGKVGHLIRDCPQQRPESSQGSIQPTGHTTSSMGQFRGPSSNRSGGNDLPHPTTAIFFFFFTLHHNKPFAHLLNGNRRQNRHRPPTQHHSAVVDAGNHR